MKLRIQRTSNDELITPDGKQSVETYNVDMSGTDMSFAPELLDVEVVGWQLQGTSYCEESDTMTLIFHDLSDAEDYL